MANPITRNNYNSHLVEKYYNLPPALRNQLRKIHHIFINDKDVNHKFKRFLNELSLEDRENNSIKRKVFRLCIFEETTPRFLIQSHFISLLICYSDDNAIIPLIKILKANRHSSIFESKLKDLPIVVKYYQSSKRDCTYELGIYDKLKEMDSDLPWYTDKFKFWENPVIVMERLYPITKYDDEYKLGISVISQLKYLHKFAIHCDIKPQNVMKRINGTTCHYLLIDYGGATTDKLGHGYRRWLWSPKWTSQPSHKSNQIVTEKNDFLELGFTMKAIQNWHTQKDDGECQSGFTGRLKKYMDRVKRIDPTNIDSSIYSDLIDILNRRS
jgi:serine/threonine protein kinase